MRFALLALVAVTLAGCGGNARPGVPVIPTYDKQFDGRFGGDPRVDAMSAADRDRALADDARSGVSRP